MSTDDDSGLQNALDLTVGKYGHIYVLDNTSTIGYRLKAFDHDTGLPISSYVQINMPVKPYRIDGSADLGLVAVLGESSSAWYVNVYDPQELP